MLQALQQQQQSNDAYTNPYRREALRLHYMLRSKRFSQKGHLKRHMIAHTKEAKEAKQAAKQAKQAKPSKPRKPRKPRKTTQASQGSQGSQGSQASSEASPSCGEFGQSFTNLPRRRQARVEHLHIYSVQPTAGVGRQEDSSAPRGGSAGAVVSESDRNALPTSCHDARLK